MATVIQDLRIEHRNMVRVLVLLEREVSNLEQEDATDYDLLLQILDYNSCYPELFHHPKEDILFRKMLERDPRVEAVIAPLLKEHKELEQLTRAFHNLLKGISVGDVVSREHVEKMAQRYIALNRKHMDTEEATVFPLAERTLADGDWEQIDEALPRADDPLFGYTVQEPYRELYERIVDLSF